MNKICSAVKKNENIILETERYIWKNPETGYKEVKTSEYLAAKFRALGYELTMAGNIPGFFTYFDTGRPGPTVLVLGELDSVICPTHPESDSTTGAVHACGHNAQCAALLGVAAALRESGVSDGLCGRIQLCAVPAEELLEIEYREQLIREGKIKYLGGKSEFLRRGYFDGVDMAFMVHTSGGFGVSAGAVGSVSKRIIYKGRSAHAGATPWLGQNALYAASCGLSAVNAIRETFKESDMIRVHPIITHGGEIVNAIPERVQLESYVRGADFESIERENRKVNRAFCGAALSLGTNIEIIDSAGYSPLINDPAMIELCKEAALLVIDEKDFTVSEDLWSASTDMGDLCTIMPVVQPFAAGCEGNLHANDLRIADPRSACITSAIWQLVMIKLLLENGAERARRIIADFKPQFATKEEFLAYKDTLSDSGDRITYNADGTATVR